MRADLTQYGVEEARTPADVDRFLAARKRHRADGGEFRLRLRGWTRPARSGMALKHPVHPSKTATVFAGGDEAAVAHLRNILSQYPPSSPSMALFKDGKPVYMLHRTDIERRDPVEISGLLKDAFDRFCV